MGKQSFRFSLQDMVRYLEVFDAEQYRYSDISKNTLCNIKKDVKIQSIRDTDEYGQFGLYQELGLIYGAEEPIAQYIHIIDLVRRKIVGEYLDIDGLGRLLNARYFQYEWEMHLENSYSEHRPSFYRDHFIHQIKDAYACMVLMDEWGLLTKMRENVSSYNTNFADYLENMANAEASQICNTCSYGIICNNMSNNNRNINKSKELIRQNIIENIIKSALIMAGLFHDNGYPIQYDMKRQDNLSKFLPTAHHFINTTNNFQQIRAHLSNSFLFRIVDESNIRDAYIKAGDEADGDHGMLSALAFLLYFYENGAVHGLSPAKRAAVELAALIMADHTIKWKAADDDKGKKYYDMINYRNPGSFLFRFCDDLQEWGRLYFYLTCNKTLRICQKCRLPIVDCEQWGGARRMPEVYHRTVCGCSPAKNAPFPSHPAGEMGTILGGQWAPVVRNDYELNSTGHFVISDMKYRRLNHVKTCDSVRFLQMPGRRSDFLFLPRERLLEGHIMLPESDKADPLAKPAIKSYLVHIDYNLFSLLQTTFMGNRFAEFRSQDLSKLKIIIQNSIDFPNTVIHSDITDNPITLKVKILERFLSGAAARCERALEEFVSHSMSKKNRIPAGITPQNIYETLTDPMVTGSKCRIAKDEILEHWLICASKEPTLDGLERYNASCLIIKLLLHPGAIYNTDDINAAMESTDTRGALMELISWLPSAKDTKSLYFLSEEDFFKEAIKSGFKLRGYGYEKSIDWDKGNDRMIERGGYPEHECEKTSPDKDETDKYPQIDTFKDRFKALLESAKSFIFANDYLKAIIKSLYLGKRSTNPIKQIEVNIEGMVEFYVNLLIASKLMLAFLDLCTDALSKDNKLSNKCMYGIIKKTAGDLVDYLVSYFQKDKLLQSSSDIAWYESASILIRDFFVQETKQLRHFSGMKPTVEAESRTDWDEENYLYAYTNKSKDKFELHKVDIAIKEYTRPRHYLRFLHSMPGEAILDSYADMHFFYKLSRASQESARF